VLVAPLVNDVASRAGWIGDLRAAGVAVEPLVVARRAYRAEWKAVKELIESRRPSVVHTHGYHGDVVGGLAALRAGAPTVATVHGFIGGDWKNRAYEWLQRQVLRRFDAVIAVARPMAMELEAAGLPAGRLHVVVNAFGGDAVPLPRAEARRALGVPEQGFRVGWVGRLSREKGADVVLRAVAAADRSVRLSVIGEGRERGTLTALAHRLGAADRVDWHGARPDAPRLMPAFDVLALTSRTEGTPVVLFEAMAACIPIVATRVGGVPDVVGDAEALLVAPDDPWAVTTAIDAVRRDPAAAAGRAAAALRRLRHFAVEPWLRRVDEVYAAAMQRARSQA
jgi:glycosyltransferase involved in cell wall biosynthesis